ncbi:MAG: formate dehydrogenase subunit alpha [Verrucomicrobiae bacterium]|nr:formate dehydrogenase subunit alpha [Verrucomicrobiae bacterium]
MFRATINGKSVGVSSGTTILDAMRTIGFDVPTACHDPRLKPYGGCRVCAVQVKGMARPLTACNTPIADGMEIETHTPEIEGLRKTLLRLLVKDYPAEAVRKYPDKPFHRVLRQYGVDEECTGKSNAALVDDSHAYIKVDMSQCIKCYRCVRICDEVQGQFVWQAWERGGETQVKPATGKNFKESECVSCGACVDTCPTGALEDKTLIERGVPTKWTKTICSYCGTGCEVNVGTRDNLITTIRPALEGPSNHGHTCVKGRYAFDYVYAKDRAVTPMIKRNGSWENVSWDEVIQYIATHFKDTIAKHGPDSIGVLSSARGTNEENYVAQKFARVVLGTNNIDCCARVCHSPTAAAMKMTLGTGAATNSLDDIAKARTIMVCGANPTEGHPVTGARIKQAALKGANLIIIDPRDIELSHYADLQIQLKPGTNVLVFNAMAATIVEEGLTDEAFIRDRLTEYDEFREYIKQFAPEKVAGQIGVPAEKIREAARMYATQKPSLACHGLGMTEHIQGTEGIMAMVNLALLTGNMGKPGTGINPLRGQNNVQGAPHMGCEPKLMAGYVPIEDVRAQFEAAWHVEIPHSKGMNMFDMLDAAVAGKFKVLWSIGYDIMLTNPNAQETRRGLEKLDLVIVQDLFMNQTAKEFGDVFLPAASSFEKDGTFMNGERRVQRVHKAVEPQGQARSDWEIVCEVARAMGKGEHFQYKTAEDIWDEVRSLWSQSKGMSYERLDQRGLQWPCPSEDHPGTDVMHTESFSHGKTTPLRRIEFVQPPETTSKDFPFLLTTGRNLYQYNASTQTFRTPNATMYKTDYLDVSPVDARWLGLIDGEEVRIRSRTGAAVLPIQIREKQKPGELYATFHSVRVFLNELTSPHRDRYTQTPEYKVTAVTVEKVNGGS